MSFAFAGLKDPAKDRLRAYGLYGRIGDENFFANTISAVEASRPTTAESDDDRR